MGFYVGRAGAVIDGEHRAPGSPWPGAERLGQALRASLLRLGHMVEAEPFAAAELLELVGTQGLKELCKRRGIEAAQHGRSELIEALLASPLPREALEAAA